MIPTLRPLEFTSSAVGAVEENQTATGIDVTVFDPDGKSSEGSGIRYQILGSPQARFFDIDTQTGVLSFVEPPDYETPRDTRNVYRVTVEAYDQNYYRSAEQDIVVSVTDVNDGGPETWDKVSIGLDSAFLFVDAAALGYLQYLRYANSKKAEAVKAGLRNLDEIADTGEFVARLGEVLPGAAGRAFRSASVSAQFAQVQRNVEPFVKAVDLWLETQGNLSNTVIKTFEVLGAAAGVWSIVALVHDSIDLDSALQAEQGPSALPPPFVPPTPRETPPDEGPTVFAADAAGDAAALEATSDALDAGHAALVLRYEEAHAPTVAALSEIEARAAAAEESLRTQIVARIERIDAAIEEVKSAARDIESVRDSMASFIESIGAFTDLFEPILDFLENPPSIDLGLFEIPLFGAVNRANIDRVLDFFSDINGAVDAALGWVLDPIFDPIREAVNGLLPNLDPLSPLTGIFSRITDALETLQSEFEALGRRVNLLRIELEEIAKIAPPDAPEFANEALHDPAEHKTTFFGNDFAEEIVGEERPGEIAAGDIAGAALKGGGGEDTLRGTAQSDYLIGDSGEDLILGNGGDDVVVGGAEPDVLYGGPGDDAIFGNGGDDLMFGGDGTGADPGDDVFVGGTGFDVAVLSGLLSESAVTREGDMLTVVGPNGTDRLVGVEVVRFDDADVAAAPEIEGGFGSYLDGTAGPDLLLGNSSDDVFFGEEGDDTMFGNGGNDVFVGGDGNDLIEGGPGDGDRAVFQNAPFEANTYVLTDRGLQVSGPRGVDILRDVEFLTFSGVNYPISDFESYRPEIDEGALAAEEGGGAIALDLASLTRDADARDDVTTFSYSVLDAPDRGDVGIEGSVLSFDPGEAFSYLGAGETRVVRTYVTATDGLGATSRPQQVEITVTGVNDPPVVAPVARNLPATVEDFAVDLAALTRDPDPLDEPEDFTYAIVDGPEAGRATIDGPLLSFSPNGRFDDLGPDEERTVTLTVTATDTDGATSEAATVSLTVIGAAPAPNAAPLFLQLPRGFVAEAAPVGTVIGRLSGFDPDGDRLSYALVDDADAQFALDGARIVLSSPFEPGSEMTRTITVRAADPDGETVTQAFEIEFSPSRDDRATDGPDTLDGTAEGDTLQGLGGEDLLRGRKGDDILVGGEGADTIKGGGGADDLDGGAGPDRLFGNGGADVLRAGPGRDVLKGGGGGDELQGGASNDRLFGSKGRDTLSGGAGDDTLIGGNGSDSFVFDLRNGAEAGTDSLIGFNARADGLHFVGIVAADLSTSTRNGSTRIEFDSGAVVLLDTSVLAEDLNIDFS